MLQWTGGSRRQEYASRKSTQSRQRQYFEQKKRQQQTTGLQNQGDIDGAGGQAYGDQAPRSLDILSLNNVAAPVSHRNGPENADNVVPHVDSASFSASPMEALKKITSAYNINPKETSSQPRLSSPIGHQDVAADVNPHEDPLAHKISPSKNYGAKKRNQNVDLHSGEISLIDLVRYEGSKNKSIAPPARESHVSFSVKGLGHVKMETPLHSPRSTKRILPLPSKATRYTQNKARRSIPFDTTKGLGMKDCKKTSQKTSMKRPADGPGGIKPRPTKRVHVDLPTNTRTTRSKEKLLQGADASIRREGMSDPKCVQLVEEQWEGGNNMGKGLKIRPEICEKNKANRAQVKFHQTTGSCSYPLHCDNLGEKYKDEEPTALNLFKECHYSNKKKGYTDTVQSAIGTEEPSHHQL